MSNPLLNWLYSCFLYNYTKISTGSSHCLFTTHLSFHSGVSEPISEGILWRLIAHQKQYQVWLTNQLLTQWVSIVAPSGLHVLKLTQGMKDCPKESEHLEDMMFYQLRHTLMKQEEHLGNNLTKLTTRHNCYYAFFSQKKCLCSQNIMPFSIKLGVKSVCDFILHSLFVQLGLLVPIQRLVIFL